VLAACIAIGALVIGTVLVLRIPAVHHFVETWSALHPPASYPDFCRHAHEALEAHHRAHPRPAEADNAAELYREAFESYPADEGRSFYQDRNPAAVKQFLKDNKEFLSRLADASRKPDCDMGFDMASGMAGLRGKGKSREEGASFSELPEPSKLAQASRLLEFAAAQAAAAGLGRECLDLATCQLRMGRHKVRGGIMFDHSWQLMVEESVAGQLWTALETCPLQETDLRFALEELKRYSAARGDLSQALRTTMVWNLATIRVESSRLAGPAAAKEQALAAKDACLLEESMSKAIALADQPLWEVPAAQVDDLACNVDRDLPIWRVWTALLWPHPYLNEDGENRARLAAVRLGIGCKLYKARHTEYPKSLADLTVEFPGQFDESIKDPFSGKPFSYALTESGCKVWSVGRDRQDDGGSTECTEVSTSPRACASLPRDIVFEFRD